MRLAAAVVAMCLTHGTALSQNDSTETSVIRPDSQVANIAGEPALELSGEDGTTIGYSLPVWISAKPATTTNTIGQFVGTLTGSSTAGNSQLLYLYKIDDDLGLAALFKAAADQKRPFVVYAMASRSNGSTLSGSPVVILPLGASEASITQLKFSEASALAHQAISWAAPSGLVESGALINDNQILLATAQQIPNLQVEKTILATGTIDWNLYTDARAAQEAAKTQ